MANENQEYGRILATTDYEMFNLLEENRDIKQNIVQKLMKSFRETDGMCEAQPIIVDRHYNVIDGQHRLEACKQLGLPVYYLVSNSTKDIIIPLNSVQEKWALEDYAKYYSKKNNENYISILEVRKQTHASIDGIIEVIGSSGGRANDVFKEGRFILDGSLNEIISKVEKMLELCFKVRGKRQINRKITRAIRYLSRVEHFNQDYLLEKIDKHKGKIHGCDTSEDYITMFRDVYNYKSKGKKLTDLDLAIAKETTCTPN